MALLISQAKFPVSHHFSGPQRAQPGPFARGPWSTQRALPVVLAMAAVPRRREVVKLGPLLLGSALAEAKVLKAPEVVRELWGKGLRVGEDLSSWSTFLAEDCIYEDLYYQEPARGKEEVLKLVRQKLLPSNSGLILESISDGNRSCGFTWRIEEKGVGIGQRGLCFLRLNSAGQVAYVRDLGEPLYADLCFKTHLFRKYSCKL
eukprot:Skav219128  [mRNA]  locus=scaffold1574:541717:542328:+ [translate_table: standard]